MKVSRWNTSPRGMPASRPSRQPDPAYRLEKGGPRIGRPTSKTSVNHNYGMGIMQDIYA